VEILKQSIYALEIALLEDSSRSVSALADWRYNKRPHEIF
jgi:hypothetical protein